MMSDLLMRLAVWLALALFTGAALARRARPATDRAALALSLVGWVLFAGHVLLAFDTHYGWSHAVAWAETAAQTEALTGLNWGGGLYINYLFGLVWLGELVWWGRDPTGYATRPALVEVTVRGFLLFMVVNGAVVFVTGPQRWPGVALAAALAWAWRPAAGGQTAPLSRS